MLSQTFGHFYIIGQYLGTGGDTVLSQTPKMGSECGGGDAVAQSGLTMMPP